MPITGKSKKKIILFNPPLYFSAGKPQALDVTVPPLGLLYLASYLNKNLPGFRASVVDVVVEGYSLELIKDLVRKEKPFLVGLTAMTPQLQGTVELAESLKKVFPRLKIFLGGPHLSADPDFLNRFKNIFDYGITGEAEKTFTESIQKLWQKKRIPILQTGETITDLDLLPLPDRRLIKRVKYSPYESMLFGRGCPYHCYYCSRPSISRKVRYRSVQNLLAEIKTLYPYCQGKIDFQDDTFTLNRERIIEFCQKVNDEKLKLKWRCNTRIDLVDEKLLYWMKKGGCELIHFGIEAGNEKIRREVVKKGNFTNEQIYKTVKLCHRVGIKFAGYFIIGHPGEGKKELAQTKKMVLSSGIDLMGLSIPTPFPGSLLYEIAKQKGIINEKIIDRFARKHLGEGYVGNYPIFVSDKVTREYVFALMKEINRKFYLNWRTFWRRFWDDLASFSKLKQDSKDFFSLIIKGVSSRKPYAEQT